MVDPERQLNPEDDGGEEIDVGAVLREAFSPEKGELPPLFFETVLLAEGIEKEISQHERKAFEERVLRRFFTSIGKDYDAWRQERWGQWRAAILLVSLLALVLGAGAAESLLPDSGWLAGPGTSAGDRRVAHYRTVAEVQPDFPVHLPEEPPQGYEIADVVLETGHPAGPRATISYRQRGIGPAGDRLDLFVRPAADEPFALPLGVTPEPIELAGVAGHAVPGPADGSASQPPPGQGGWVLWELGEGRFGLTSATLPGNSLAELAKQLVAQLSVEGRPR